MVLALAAATGVAEVAALAASPPLGAALLSTSGLLCLFARRGMRLERVSGEGASSPVGPMRMQPRLGDRETDLTNRAHLLAVLEREMALAVRHTQAMTLAVVEVKLAGERQLDPAAFRSMSLHVASALKRICRESDFIARLEGPRFAVVLTPCNAEQAFVFTERVQVAVENRPLTIQGEAAGHAKVSLAISTAGLDRGRFRSPAEFLQAAGGDERTTAAMDPRPVRGKQSAAADVRDLRRQLVRGYRARETDNGGVWIRARAARTG
ncbi:MAG: diguanylate cyclase [Dehalococcoidia bacterium]|nr:diguanylate cyclase [Dehalococcoidia bacterium]